MPQSLKTLLQDVTVHAARPEDVDGDAVHEALTKHALAVVRGVVRPEEIVRSRTLLREHFDAGNDRPSLGEDPQELKGNFQKLAIGGAQGYGTYRPRCMRTLYNPIWAEDIYGLRSVFARMARVRNVIYRLDIDFAVDAIDDGMWTASRIHHYPRGGGFLISHRDTVVPVMQRDRGFPNYYQPLLVMSRKGVDFTEGGGFVEREGERHYYEALCEYGDIVIYDGRTVHGVADIDPQHRFRHDTVEGRLAGFVTLYKDMQKGDSVKGADPWKTATPGD